MMINPDIFNNILPYLLPYLQNLNGGAQNGRPTYTPSGQIYNGPFKNDNRTPFRTVDPVKEGAFQPAYNQGLNASSAQLYDHFRGRPGMNPVDAGLYGAGATQSLEDFANRGKPVPANVPPPNRRTAGLGNNFNGFLGNLNGGSIFNFSPEQIARMNHR